MRTPAYRLLFWPVVLMSLLVSSELSAAAPTDSTYVFVIQHDKDDEAYALRIGRNVRLETRNGITRDGTIDAITADSIRIGSRAVAVADIESVRFTSEPSGLSKLTAILVLTLAGIALLFGIFFLGFGITTLIAGGSNAGLQLLSGGVGVGLGYLLGRAGFWLNGRRTHRRSRGWRFGTVKVADS